MADTPSAGRRDEPAIPARKDHWFVANLLLEIERRFDVNALAIDNVKLWPLVRLQLARSIKAVEADDQFVPPRADDNPGTSFPQTKAEFPQTKAELTTLLKDYQASARLDRAKAKRRVAADFDEMARRAGPTFAVLSKIEKYFIERADGRTSPILDPVIEDLKRYGRVETLALEPLPFRCVNEPVRIDVAAWRAVHAVPKDVATPAVDALFAEIEAFARAQFPQYPLDRALVYQRFNRMRRSRDYFHEILQRLAPEFVVMSSFTGWMHALWAAKDLGIPTIDVQHGGLGPIYLPITQIGRVPPEGYHFLPDVLWLWDDNHRLEVAKWLPGAAQRHVPVVGGHRGVARWLAELRSGRLAAADRAFIERFKDRPNVLVSLSYAVDPLMPDAMFAAIAATPDVHWLIRLHPLHRSSAVQQQLTQHLVALGCSNVSIDEPTGVQLQSAFHVSRAHITPFSGTIFDAATFGVPTALGHPRGRKLFSAEIDSGLFAYTANADEIVAFVRKHVRANVASGISPAVAGTDDAIGNVIAAAQRVRAQAPPLTTQQRRTWPMRSLNLVRRLIGR